MTPPARLLLLFLAALLLDGPVSACSVPVFRYALERWKPSAYQAFVLHDGPLSPQHQACLDRLTESGVNLVVTCIDAGKTTAGVSLKRIHQARARRLSFPCLVLQYPEEEATSPPAWMGPLDADVVQQLIDSPARRQIVERLARGESAIWVLVTSGDQRADEAAAMLLERELGRLQRVIDMPPPKPEDVLLTDIPLRLAFSVLRIDRQAPRERLLAHLLLGTEEHLAGVSGPVVFPVIGRGRVLVGLHGEDLRPATLERWASYLSQGCSCQIKELNPGVDLLLDANWSTLLNVTERPGPLSPVALPAPTIPPGETPSSEVPVAVGEPEAQAWDWRPPGILATLVAGTCIWWILSRPRATR